MLRTMFLTLSLLLCLQNRADAQYLFVGPGSTPQGDYLRGMGIAAYGVGIGEHNLAMARSIDVDTTIRFNEYVAAVIKNENAENARHREAQRQKNLASYNSNRERIRNSPEARDVDDGDSLNALLDKLNEGIIQESTHRLVEIRLSNDEVRRIPFKLRGVGTQSFSMRRLTLKQRGKWPPAFQDRRFDGVRRGYDRAMDVVLEQEFNGAMQLAAIDDLKQAIGRLSEELDKALSDDPKDRRFIEGRQRIRELEATVEMLKTHKLETVLGDLDRYAGTTVNDLRIFMRTHDLRFAAAKSQEEKTLFPELFAKLGAHYDEVKRGVVNVDDR